ncbi:MAG TPA: hypothetical protein VNI77_09455 [Nitrososphaera sp.]|nr:hypothetical protein [Nitrososphaera sp.]
MRGPFSCAIIPLLQAVVEEEKVREEATIFTRTHTERDSARWYNNEACSGWLRLRHYVYGTELKKEKSLMERFIQNINDRTECFDDYCPCRKRNCNRKHVWNWLKLFLLYLDIGTDRMRFTLFLVRDGG